MLNIFTILILTLGIGFAQVKETFSSVSELMSEFGDYSTENGTFK